MSRSDHRTLLNHGRKAGLNTREIYAALATRQPEAQESSNRTGDGNGFVSEYTPGGIRVYRPMGIDGHE